MLARRALRASCLAALLASATGARTAQPDSDAIALEQRIISIHESFAQAVVRVKIVTEELDAAGKPTRWVFSGFFINREGRVLTNIAAAGKPSRIWVEKDGLPYLAELVGSDPVTDLALLQVVKLPEKFEIIPVEATTDRLPIGSFVVAITSPLEFDPTPFLGLVAGYESFFTNFRFPFTYVRVTVPAGPGESGSPVLDLKGRLAGISVASLPDVRSSYLVPAGALTRIVEDLSSIGRVAYSTLPVKFIEKPDAANLTRQVIVAAVDPGSSASRADVRVGDVLRQLGSDTVRNIHDVRDALFQARPGQFISLEVERDGRRIPFALPLEERKEIEIPEPPESSNTRHPSATESAPEEESTDEAKPRESLPLPRPGFAPPTRPRTG